MVSGGAAMIMGWLYMRYSLISAIVAHFIVDLVVYVIPRLLAAIA
jgi:membrane protease YdiL (CAAX protease family)